MVLLWQNSTSYSTVMPRFTVSAFSNIYRGLARLTCPFAATITVASTVAALLLAHLGP
jgi:hypothetical protein